MDVEVPCPFNCKLGLIVVSGLLNALLMACLVVDLQLVDLEILSFEFLFIEYWQYSEESSAVVSVLFSTVS